VRDVLGYFGTAVMVLFVIMALLYITARSSSAAGERGFVILILILIGAGIGSIISVIRRRKERPGFVRGVLGCFAVAFIMVSIMVPSASPVVSFVLVLMGAGIIGITSVIRRIIVRRRQ
jgi:hypothetical protein